MIICSRQLQARAKYRGFVKTFIYLSFICTTLQLPQLASAQLIEHEVNLAIPSYLGIRIVNNAGEPRGAPAVSFDYTSDVAAYTNAYEGSGFIGTSDVTDFADVQVSVRTGFGFPLWYVTVQALELTSAGAGLDLEDIEVVRGSVSGLNQQAVVWGGISNSWALSSAPQTVAYSLLGTYGWQTLGFNGLDYRVKVDGDEEPGEYSTTVTYAIFYP